MTEKTNEQIKAQVERTLGGPAVYQPKRVIRLRNGQKIVSEGAKRCPTCHAQLCICEADWLRKSRETA